MPTTKAIICFLQYFLDSNLDPNKEILKYNIVSDKRQLISAEFMTAVHNLCKAIKRLPADHTDTHVSGKFGSLSDADDIIMMDARYHVSIEIYKHYTKCQP